MDFKKLLAYQKSFDLAMLIFEISKSFPKEETYSLTNQIRRSSRSVCENISEAYRKRRYPKHFISKLTDADGENSETNTWLDFALKCDYISTEDYYKFSEQGKRLGNSLII
jgi:four helix bundle protein